MSRELMSQIIGDFGQEIGTQLEVDDEAYCCLAVGEDMQVHLKFNEHFNGLIFYSEIGEIPSIGQKEIMRHYVMENGSISSDNLTFCYDNDEKKLGMARLLMQEFMNLDNFKKILEKFIERNMKERENMGRYMQGDLPKDDIRFADTGSSEAPAAGGVDMQMMRM